MDYTRFPVLIRLNQYGVIEKIIVPDLHLDLTLSLPIYQDLFQLLNQQLIPFQILRGYLEGLLGEGDGSRHELRNVPGVLFNLQSELQHWINHHELKDLMPLDESAWVVKKNKRPIQWEEMKVAVPQSSFRCRNVMTPMIIGLYVFSTVLDAWLNFYIHTVNNVPIIMAGITVLTDIITTTPDYFASDLEDNTNRLFSCAPIQMGSRHRLADDFIIEETKLNKKTYWIIGGIFFVAQCFTTGSTLVSDFVNEMSQYNSAYSGGLVFSWLPYNAYIGLAMLDFVLDNAFQLIVPFSTMITVGPKIEKLILRCRKKCCEKSTNDEDVTDEKDEKTLAPENLSRQVTRGYHRNGLFGANAASDIKIALLEEPQNGIAQTPRENSICNRLCTIL